MVRCLLLIVTLPLIFLAQSAQSTNQKHGKTTQPPQTAPIKTAGLLNGTGWVSFPEMGRGMYIAGVRDSILATAVIKQQPPQANQIDWADSFTVEDYEKELDAFYKDRENIRIPVVLAIWHITVKFKGHRTKQELESLLLELRELISEAK
jgi:hypothetical protein